MDNSLRLSSMNNQRTTVLVVVAHADDEVLGCGGTIARYAAEGAEVHILILADGVTARDVTCDQVLREAEVVAREAAARQAAQILGAHPPTFARFPDNRCDTVPLLNIVKKIESVVGFIRPSVIYTHHGNDLNIDHRISHQAVLTACRPLPDSPVREILAFETPSSTEWEPVAIGERFHPNRFVNISDFTERKRQAIAVYDTEIRTFPHPRSPEAIEALGLLRGSQSGLNAAEAFVVVREVSA